MGKSRLPVGNRFGVCLTRGGVGRRFRQPRAMRRRPGGYRKAPRTSCARPSSPPVGVLGGGSREASAARGDADDDEARDQQRPRRRLRNGAQREGRLTAVSKPVIGVTAASIAAEADAGNDALGEADLAKIDDMLRGSAG